MTHTGKITRRGQVTIPQELRDRFGLKEGDVVLFEEAEGRIHLVPTALVPADQAWFWNKKHQAKEREAEEDLQQGRYEEFSSADELIKDLRRGKTRKKAS